MNVFKYMRNSSKTQTAALQSHAIHSYIRLHKLPYGYCEVDVCRGDVPYRQRNLAKIIDKMSWGDLLIVQDMTRLGRELFVLMEIVIDVFHRGGKIVCAAFDYIIEPRMKDMKMVFVAHMLGAEVEHQYEISRAGWSAEARRKKMEMARLDKAMAQQTEQLKGLIKLQKYTDLSSYYTWADLEREQHKARKESERRKREWRNKPHPYDCHWQTIETMAYFNRSISDIARFLQIPYSSLYAYMTRKGLARNKSSAKEIYQPGYLNDIYK